MERLLEDAMERLPGCLATGIADARHGGLLAAAGDGAQMERLEVAAAAGASILDGANVARLALLLAPNAGATQPREAMVVSASGIDVMVRLGDHSERILIALCARPPRYAGRILTEARAIAAQATGAQG